MTDAYDPVEVARETALDDLRFAPTREIRGEILDTYKAAIKQRTRDRLLSDEVVERVAWVLFLDEYGHRDDAGDLWAMDDMRDLFETRARAALEAAVEVR